MKLTKIHIFLILLLALVLCSTLGVCYNQGMEGFTNRSDDKRTYESYSNYLTQKNDDNIRSINHSDKRSSNFNNPFYNRANWRTDKDMDRNRDRDRDRDRTDLNAGDERDRSNMNTRKTKYSEFHNSDFDSNTRLLDRLGIFDSVSKGKMNAPMFNVTDATTNANENKNANTQQQQEGIPKSIIPPGQENLYILKSEIVPPVCPACPTVNCGSCASDKKCPPCPPCARCPEPSFECKKVPNYNSVGLMNQLPIPWASKL